MEKTLEELKLEADTLGIKYSPNIGHDKLATKIDEWYTAESKANTAPVIVAEDAKEVAQALNATSKQSALAIIKEQEKENLQTVVVKLSMVDKREASTATHAYFSTGDHGMTIPLDVFVELPKILVAMAEDARAVTHIEQNGSVVTKLQKKYVVEYKGI